MKCTAPCIPHCEREATHELLSLQNSHLGFNCDEHLNRLRFEKAEVDGQVLNAEYKKRLLNSEDN